jgi:hypothetical protein
MNSLVRGFDLLFHKRGSRVQIPSAPRFCLELVEKPSFLTLARGGVGGSARHRDSTTAAAIHTMTTSQIERRSMLMAVSERFWDSASG